MNELCSVRVRPAHFVVSVIAAAAVLVSACGGGSAKSSSNAVGAASGSAGGAAGGAIPAGDIKIGMVAEESGAGAAIGNYQVSTQKALAGYINAHGGIAGHQVQLVVENNQSDAAIAVTAARKLVADGVSGVVYTGLSSSGKDQVVAILAKAKIPTVDPEPLPKYDDATQFPYFFTDNPIDTNAMVAVSAFAKKRGYDQIGQLGDGTPFAASLEQNFTAKAKDQGLDIVKTVDYPTTATDMTTQLSQLKASGAKTIGLWCEVGCGKVFDGLRQLNWSPNILTTLVLYFSGFTSVKELGANTWGDCPISVASGAQPPTELADIITTVAAQTGGQSVTDQGIPLNADSWLILKDAIEKANSTDGAKMRAVIESITNQSFSDPDVKYTFSAQHHAGFDAANPLDISVCGFDKLGALQLPVKAS